MMKYAVLGALFGGAAMILVLLGAWVRHNKPRREIRIGGVSERWLADIRDDEAE